MSWLTESPPKEQTEPAAPQARPVRVHGPAAARGLGGNLSLLEAIRARAETANRRRRAAERAVRDKIRAEELATSAADSRPWWTKIGAE